jgi:hypothetical protein
LFSFFIYCFIYFSFCFMQPRWTDLDINQHVNNVKYIGWILEVIFLLLMCVFVLLGNFSV